MKADGGGGGVGGEKEAAQFCDIHLRVVPLRNTSNLIVRRRVQLMIKRDYAGQ